MDFSILVLSGLTVGIVEAIKKYVEVDKRYIPLIALGIGVTIAFIGGKYVDLIEWQQKVLAGLMMGLSSMGLYSGSKTMIEEEVE